MKMWKIVRDKLDLYKDIVPNPWNSKWIVYHDAIHFLWGGKDKDWYYWGIQYNKYKTWEYAGKQWYSRRWGFEKDWYDHPRPALCLYYVTIFWYTYWISDKGYFVKESEK